MTPYIVTMVDGSKRIVHAKSSKEAFEKLNVNAVLQIRVMFKKNMKQGIRKVS